MSKAICLSNKEIPEDMLLGYLLFYNLGEIKINEAELEAIFVKNNIDTGYIKKISKVDAFRRATTKTKKTININHNGENKRVKIEVDEVKCNDDEVVRILGRKLVDEKNESLSYQAVGRIAFDRVSGTIGYGADDYYSDEYDYKTMLEDTINLYREWSVYHTKDTVRNVTNNVQKDMYPTTLLPGGLAKFIPKSSKTLLYSLQGVVRDLSDYGDECLFEVIPVIDTEEQRQLVGKAATREIKEDLFNFTQELKQIITDKQVIPMRSATSYIEKFKDLKGKVDEYEGLLGSYMGAITQQIQVAMKLVNTNSDSNN